MYVYIYACVYTHTHKLINSITRNLIYASASSHKNHPQAHVQTPVTTQQHYPPAGQQHIESENTVNVHPKGTAKISNDASRGTEASTA
jgi:hypothetical protein